MRSLPDGLSAYKRTREFDENTLPAGLRANHRTREGVWGRIVVLEGRLRYTIERVPSEVHDLEPGAVGVVEPGVPHRVEAMGAVRFYVEFLR